MPAPAAVAPLPLGASARPRAARRRRFRGDGGASSLELAIVTPVLFAAIGTVVQVGLWYHAQAIGLAAAQEGARAARLPAASAPAADAAGVARARAYLDQLGSDVLRRTTVQVTPERGVANARATSLGGITDVVSIRVRADVVSVVPGLTLSVDEVSTVPVERFRGDQEAGP